MKLIQANWNPAPRQLRQFAATCLIVAPLLGWLWGAPSDVLFGLAVAGLIVGLVGFAMPVSVKPLYLTLMAVTAPIGMILGELAMLTIYFGLFLPMGLIFRLLRRDALQLKLDRSRPSYWQPKPQPKHITSYYRQF